MLIFSQFLYIVIYFSVMSKSLEFSLRVYFFYYVFINFVLKYKNVLFWVFICILLLCRDFQVCVNYESMYGSFWLLVNIFLFFVQLKFVEVREWRGVVFFCQQILFYCFVCLVKVIERRENLYLVVKKKSNGVVWCCLYLEGFGIREQI